jgi:Domain of unknown function (DUF4349)
MRLLDQDPIDPEIAGALDAIDATLAGEPVDARYAELAEVALLLASDRPQVPPAFAHSLDERVERRFAPAPSPARGGGRRRLSRFWEATGALAAAVALIVAIVVVVGNSHSGPSSDVSSSASSSAPPTAASSSASSSAPPTAASSTASSSAPPTAASTAAGGTATTSSGSSSAGAPHTAASGAARSPGRSPLKALAPGAASAPANSPAAIPPSTLGSSTAGAPTLQPPTTGRKVVQSAQLSLAAAPNRIDDVAQQVYNVIGALNGIVENSTVTQTGGADGYAEFQLSVPSASLGQAMSRLSSLNNATVVSRTDNTQDITDQYGQATRSLADARALRTSLLKQLASATTTEQIDSLRAQIHDAEASISSDLATLNRLNHQVNFSELYLTINAHAVPAPVSHGGGGFGVGRAAHDAGRVLTVAAGVALIAIAALTPVGLLVALAWWVGAAVRRRRREQALDSV